MEANMLNYVIYHDDCPFDVDYYNKLDFGTLSAMYLILYSLPLVLCYNRSTEWKCQIHCSLGNKNTITSSARSALES